MRDIPMLVSFTGARGGCSASGWVVIDCGPVRTAKDVETLCDAVAEKRGYDKATFVILSFQRLEQ